MSQTSVFDPGIHGGDLWGTLGRVTLDALGVFTVRGDGNPVYNYDARPIFGPVLGACFYVGLLLSVWRLFREKAGYRTTAYLLLCQSGAPTAIRVSALSGLSYNYPTALQLDAVIAPGSTDAKTYTVRLGMGARGTLYVNSNRTHSHLFGDALQATMTIEEFLP